MIKYSVKRPLTVAVVIIVLFVLGFGSYRSMTPDLLPSIDLPYVIVLTPYPGATPEKIESEITKPLEQQMASLENLENISSSSDDNLSLIFLEFSEGANLEATTVDILQKATQAESGWDDTVGKPQIIKINPNILPIMVAAAEYEGKNTTELTDFMEDTMQVRLEGISGVASLEVVGMVSKQVNVVLNEDKIDEINDEIAEILEREFDDKKAELNDTKKDLQSQVKKIEKGSKNLTKGVPKMLEKAGEGSAELAKQERALQDKLDELSSQIINLNSQLNGMLLVEQLMGPMAPDQTAAKKKIQGGITQLEKLKTALQKGKISLSDAEIKMDGAMMQGLFDLSSTETQLAVAQAQMTSAIEQIKSGLDQIDTAEEDALKQADFTNVLTLDALTQMLTAQNFSMPAGYVHQGSDDYLVRVGAETESEDELNEMILMDMNMDDLDPIKLSDVADVFMSDNFADIYAKINGNDGILLTFTKQSIASTAEASNNIKDKFDELSKEYPGLKFTPLMDQGDYIYIVINTITENLIFGALFAIIVLFLFLRDLRPTFITLCSIPISLVFAIVLMYFSNVTINIFSLSGLAVAVGMLVDNSIVVIENIFRLKAKGFSSTKAAVTGTKQVIAPITAATLTTVCVFAPIIFISGITKDLFTDLALTLAYALFASLIIAVTLVPAMAGGLFKNMQPKQSLRFDKLVNTYEKMLRWTLRHKAFVLIISIVLLVGSASAVMVKGFIFMPESNMPQISVTMTAPEEATFEELTKITDDSISKIKDIDGVDIVGAMASADDSGNSMGMMSMGGSGGANQLTSSIYVILEDGANSNEISDKMEKALSDVGGEVDIASASMMDITALSGQGVGVDLFADDIDDLFAAVNMIEEKVSEIKGVDTVEGGSEDADKELRFTVDRKKAAKKGLTVAQVFMEVQKALGEESSATTVTWESGTFDVMTVANKEETLTPEFIENFKFKATQKDGAVKTVKLKDVTTMEEFQSLSSIQRDNQRRHLPLTVMINEDENITLMSTKIENVVNSLDLPDGVRYEFTGENEAIMEAFEQLGIMLLLGLALVYLVMVAQFHSLKNPLIIMFAVPLAFTGGFIALLITGMELSVVSLVGFIMLVGIIVSNTIVLVDFIYQLRTEGVERQVAIVEAGKIRMRPILMTACTNIMGLVMMAFSTGNGAEMMKPLAIVCIGGLIYATFMTMFVVPIVYDMINKKDIKVIAEEELAAEMDA